MNYDELLDVEDLVDKAQWALEEIGPDYYGDDAEIEPPYQVGEAYESLTELKSRLNEINHELFNAEMDDLVAKIKKNGD